jgi:hypothetical protein
MLRQFERQIGRSCLANLYVLSLGDPDGTTGWYAANYAPAVEVHCVIPTVTVKLSVLRPGLHAAYGHSGYTLDDMAEGDIIEDYSGNYHRVRAVKPHQIGQRLLYFELQLEQLENWTAANLAMPKPNSVLSLSSQKITDSLVINEGTISIDSGVPNVLPCTIDLEVDSYTATFAPPSGSVFSYWDYTNVSIGDFLNNPCTFTPGVLSCSLKAMYWPAYYGFQKVKGFPVVTMGFQDGFERHDL